MRSIHRLAAMAALLALLVTLAACRAVSEAPSASPPAPAPTESPSSEKPSPTQSPSVDPSESPTPVPVIVRDIPMIGRIVEDEVEVRTHPLVNAPLVIGESFADPDAMPEVVLRAGDRVAVTLGPLVNDDQSWYEVASVDGGDVNFAFGWIPADAFERDADLPAGFPVIVTIHGQGEGDSVDSEVIVGTPVTVRYAALPMSGADECDIEVSVTATDGTTIEIASETLTEIRIEELSTFQLPELFQDEAGTVTLTVETDCSFAATMTTPPS